MCRLDTIVLHSSLFVIWLLTLQSALSQTRGLKSIESAIYDLQSEDRRVQAADDLVAEGPGSLPALAQLWKQSDGKLRIRAFDVIYRISLANGHLAGPAVPILVDAIRFPNSTIPVQAIEALGAIGRAARSAIPVLTDEIANDNTKKGASDALSLIATDIQEGLGDDTTAFQVSDEELASTIRTLAPALTRVEAAYGHDRAREVRLALFALKREASWRARRPHLRDIITFYLKPSLYFRLTFFYIVAFLTLWSLLFLIAPRSLLSISQMLHAKSLYGLTVLIRHITFLSLFEYRTRVLDSWVRTNIPKARIRFESVAKRALQPFRLPVPVSLDDFHSQHQNIKLLEDLRPGNLHPIFSDNRTFILIKGEGGSGKTNVAIECGRWAMADAPAVRLAPYLMLPIFLDKELHPCPKPGHALFASVQLALSELIDSKSLVSSELTNRLLQSKRLLVTIDRLSELSEATNEEVNSPVQSFPNLMVTSRTIPNIASAREATILEPRRLDGIALTHFIEGMLERKGVLSLFDPEEVLKHYKHLITITGRQVTVLLAKLYCDYLELLKEDVTGDTRPDSPSNIPDLMLTYINRLNRARVPGRHPDNAQVHSDLKTIAWECVRRRLYPERIKYSTIIPLIGGDSPESRLEYLEEILLVIVRDEPAMNMVRFALDPIAEYMAAMRVVESHAADTAAWDAFFVYADGLSAVQESTTSFLKKVYECCLVDADSKVVPEAVVSQLKLRLMPVTES